MCRRWRILGTVVNSVVVEILNDLIASWAVVRGIFEIVAAIQLRKELTNEWLLILGGVFSIIFGVLLFLNPAAGALAMVWLIGSYTLVFGIMMIMLSFRLRGLRKLQPATA